MSEIIFYGRTLDYLFDARRAVYGLMPDDKGLSVSSDGTLIYTIYDTEGNVNHKIRIGKHRYTKDSWNSMRSM